MSDQQSEYAQSGVDIDAGQRAVSLMQDAIEATYTPQVLSKTGNFGGLYDASALKDLDKPVLVASTDGVGTKSKVAARLNQWDSIGQDLVNHCINDILVQGAEPLFFLDYVASDKLLPEQMATVVGGMAKACQEAGIPLLGGETAEMPGVYLSGEMDLVGTIVGMVDRAQMLDGQRIRPDDAIIVLESTGLHTNGYSLARRVLADMDWTTPHDDLNTSIGEALLAVHRSYLADIHLLREKDVDIHGMAHITGGGLMDNVPRMLRSDVDAVMMPGLWKMPSIFRLIQEAGSISTDEMFRVFNMGAGLVIVVPANEASFVEGTLPHAWRAGRITSGTGELILELQEGQES